VAAEKIISAANNALSKRKKNPYKKVKKKVLELTKLLEQPKGGSNFFCRFERTEIQ